MLSVGLALTPEGKEQGLTEIMVLVGRQGFLGKRFESEIGAGRIVLHQPFTLLHSTETSDLPASLLEHVHSFDIIVAEVRNVAVMLAEALSLTSSAFLQLLGSFGDNEFLPGASFFMPTLH